MNELDRLGLRKNTVVILWGDHGYQLGEHGTWNKRTNWEVAARVPLMISVPGQMHAGEKTDALVELIDMYPTLAQLCRLDPPAGLEGKVLFRCLRKPDLPWKEAAFTTYYKPLPEMGTGFGRAMRTDRYRFVEWSGPKSKKKVYELYDEVPTRWKKRTSPIGRRMPNSSPNSPRSCMPVGRIETRWWENRGLAPAADDDRLFGPLAVNGIVAILKISKMSLRRQDSLAEHE